jgi:hypothetical protein
VEVPSLVLWRRVLEDHRVNSPFQRFKRNLLLFMQLLLLALLALAAMQPFVDRRARQDDRYVVMIDCSASMAAVGPAGRTRLEVAKDRVREMIGSLSSGQAMALISFSNTGRQLCGFTDNPRVLRDALAEAAVEVVPSQLEDAFRVAEGLHMTHPFQRLVVLSDGNFPEQTAFKLPFKEVNFQRLPPAEPNMGITELNARRGRTGTWDVLVQVEASAGDPLTGTLELLLDGEVQDVETVLVEQGAPERLVFQVPGETGARVAVRLLPTGRDSLPADNRAWLELPRTRSVAVYVPRDMRAWRRALRALPDARVFPESGVPDPESYDLIIAGEAADLDLSSRVFMADGVVPAAVEPLLQPHQGASEMVHADPRFPLLEHVVLEDLVAYGAPRRKTGALDVDFESRGYQVVVSGDNGPLLLHRRLEGRVYYHLLFDTARSTLPLRVAFPIMAGNLVRQAARESGLAEVRAHTTGALTVETGGAAGHYRVGPEGGHLRVIEASPNGILSGVPAPQVGRYRIRGPGVDTAVGAALLNAGETSLARRDAIKLEEGLSVDVAEARVRTNRPLWRVLAALAFCVLLVEWWYYSRRPGG